MITRVSRGGWRRVVARSRARPGVGGVRCPRRRPASARRPGKVSAKVRERWQPRGEPAIVDVLVRFRQAPGASERTAPAIVRRPAPPPAPRLLPLDGRSAARPRPWTGWPRAAPSSSWPATSPCRRPWTSRVRPRTSRCRRAPESLLKGAGVTIAMLDSGVAPHPDIQTLVASVDFVGNQGDPTAVLDLPDDTTRAEASSVDPNGHGTHVAGILVGSGSHSPDGPPGRHRPRGEPRLRARAGRGGQREDVGRPGRPAVGARPQGRARHPRPEPVARPPRVRAGRARPAGAGGRGALERRDRRRVLGGQRRPQRRRHDHQPLQLARGHQRRGQQRPQDAGHSRTTRWRPTPRAAPRASTTSPSPTSSRPATGSSPRGRAGSYLDLLAPESRVAGRSRCSGGDGVLRAVGHEHGGAHGRRGGRADARAGARR